MTSPTHSGAASVELPAMESDPVAMKEAADEIRRIGGTVDVALAATNAAVAGAAGTLPSYSLGPAMVAAATDLAKVCADLASYSREHSDKVRTGAERYETVVRQGQQALANTHEVA